MTGSHDHARALLRDRAAGVVGELDAGRRDDRHLLVAEEHDVARVAEDRRDVRGDEELARRRGRRRSAGRCGRSTILFGIVGRDQHEREQPAHVQQRAPHRVLEPVVLHLALDEVRDDLGVGLGDERVPFLLELLLQIQVVLDDAVVDDDDPAGAVAVRMRVLLGRPAVRRPARVADAVVPLERRRRDHLLEARQLAGAAPQLDRCRCGRPRRPPSRSRGIRAAAARRSGSGTTCFAPMYPMIPHMIR